MAYEKQEWKNGKDGGTPVSADRLNHIEEGIASIPAGERGPAGKDGAPGKDGAKGEPGAPGKDAEPQFTADEVTKLKALAAG